MEIPVIVELLRVTLILCLIGLLAGGGLGALCAVLARPVLLIPRLRQLFIFLPWRTALFGSLLILWSPFGALLVDFRPIRVEETIGISLALLAYVFTIEAMTDHWYPSALSARLIAVARTLATGSVVIIVLAGFYESWGYGYAWQQRMSQAIQQETAWEGWLIVAAIALAIDLLLGIAQSSLNARARTSPIDKGLSLARRLIGAVTGKGRH